MTIASKLDMSYEFYFKQNMQYVEWRLNKTISWVMALDVSGTLIGTCEIGDEKNESISLSSLVR